MATVSASIVLDEIRVYAYHGCLAEETKIGSDYRVRLRVWADLSKSVSSDELSDTVDYVLLNRIVKEEMAIPSKLLEHVAGRISERIFRESALVDELEVEVSKINPPIGGDVSSVMICLRERLKD
ncbi:dihydroneopterin aldolase [Flavobacterium aurantiibacter]|uniref:7,8-dihydroneopterin aldolase n=1 Tax=Flavobacterium aurantiibacter TaxID=2023067 RepID=A0A255ZJ77_9FLAO|nr:dihydroneopterin aldolase [Flavobacterium aurantiibacter]OYQ41536.1 dihydroneopterin aldolase [Flavobacterium aurantiibacter]